MKTMPNYEETYFFRGYPYNLRRLEVEDTFPLHWHHYVEIIYSMQEGLIYEIDGERVEVDKGDLLFIWPGELHGIKQQSKPWNALMLQFDSQLLTQRLDFQRSAHLFYNTRWIQSSENQELVTRIQQNLHEIQRLSVEEEDFLEMKVCRLIYNIIICLGTSKMHVYGRHGMPKTAHKQQVNRQILEACQYITLNCKKKISLEEVADIAGFSKYHFSKVFKKYTGSTFFEFHNKERLRIAETLLKNPELSVTHVALESGFDSISTFNRIFKQFKKVNPTEFRAMYLHKNV